MTECQFCLSHFLAASKPVRKWMMRVFPNLLIVSSNTMPGGQWFVSGFGAI